MLEAYCLELLHLLQMPLSTQNWLRLPERFCVIDFLQGSNVSAMLTTTGVSGLLGHA